jgi:hypothetical protein
VLTTIPDVDIDALLHAVHETERVNKSETVGS